MACGRQINACQGFSLRDKIVLPRLTEPQPRRDFGRAALFYGACTESALKTGKRELG